MTQEPIFQTWSELKEKASRMKYNEETKELAYELGLDPDASIFNEFAKYLGKAEMPHPMKCYLRANIHKLFYEYNSQEQKGGSKL